MISSEYRVQDLGELTGDVLLYGGAYSNWQAYRALMARASDVGIKPKQRICTGDIIGYCADGQAIYDDMTSRGEGAQILGNVEVQIRDDQQDCGCGFEAGTQCDLASDVWFAHAKTLFERPDRPTPFADWPDIITFRHAGARYGIVHGGVRDKSRFIWSNSDAAVFLEEIASLEQLVGRIDCVIAGHSGIPFERQVGRVSWVNAGVIGMPPHDGRAETRFAVLGSDGMRIHKLSYDFETAARSMEAVGLVQGYETALRCGYWPSEDILPHDLRRQAEPA